MSADEILSGLRDLVQIDVGNRGLARAPRDNLFTACPNDFASACRSIAEHSTPRVGIVTGFMIPAVEPPIGETDGPLGALFLARAFQHLGIACVLASDEAGIVALSEGVKALGLVESISVIFLPDGTSVPDSDHYRADFHKQAGKLTHLIAVERVGPNHRVSSLRAQPSSTPDSIGRFVHAVARPQRGRCFTMRGRDLTPLTAPAHHLFEGPRDFVTIGIGDGGNEIGMGKISWDTIRRNIPNGEVIACRVATDHLIVAGVSNWGAYALGAGVMVLRGKVDASLFDVDRERSLLETLANRGPLVDGVTGQRSATVDGLTFEQYARPLRQFVSVIGRR
jgi:D-glutamate cyclase